MNGAPPGPSKGQSPKKLPLEELKSLFFKFLVQQGYAVPGEAEAIFGGNKPAASSRASSPSPSVCSRKNSSSALSSDDASDQSGGTVKGLDGEVEDRPFTQVCRKSRKLARWQRTNSNTTDTINIELDINTGVSTVGNNTSASANSFGSKATVAAKINKKQSASSLPAPEIYQRLLLELGHLHP
ncbi:hypothetical protein EVAR_33719_1 [Eumeta japonica]|uniref:Uncharacterized protein n=1 Tax=Eumeta variegata TaxID=151549 RepID=A0A4C1VRK6_EUMVA|nr:hypothetical protein EVAR_33719_1 [Eumeta japonica]